MKLEEFVVKTINKEKLENAYYRISILAQNKLKEMILRKFTRLKEEAEIIEFHKSYMNIYNMVLSPESFTVEELQRELGYNSVNMAIDEGISRK